MSDAPHLTPPPPLPGWVWLPHGAAYDPDPPGTPDRKRRCKSPHYTATCTIVDGAIRTFGEVPPIIAIACLARAGYLTSEPTHADTHDTPVIP